MGVDPEYLLMLWGADPDAPVDDPATWRWASPHWSPDREAMMARKWAAALAGEVDPEADETDPVEAFRAQYLNVWPSMAAGARVSRLAGWPDMPQVRASEPPPGGLVVIDQAPDGSVFGLLGWADGGAWYREADTLPEALALAGRWAPAQVIVGLSLRGAVAKAGWHGAVGMGARETTEGTPLLLEAVRRRSFAHEHEPGLSAQADGAQVVLSDTGAMRLSVKGSRGSVLGLKLAAWALLHERNDPRDRPAIW